MKNSLIAAIAFATTLIATAGCDYEELSEHPCPPGGTPDTYENFGMEFFRDNCNVCHSADLDQRQGAPENFVFASQASIQEHAARIFVRAAGENSSMPPGPDDPPAAERERLADWLACGAP